MENMYEDIDMSTDFTRMVDEDIEKCNLFEQENHNYQEKRKFFIELVGKYSAHIAGFGDGLYGYNNSTHSYDLELSDFDDNIIAIKFKLISYKNNNYRNTKNIDNDVGLRISNTLTANQTQTLTISFEEVKQKIKDMTGLSESETDETLARVNEIQNIVNQNESRKAKWQKVKPILNWLADKSVDVGCALLPLILKIGE